MGYPMMDEDQFGGFNGNEMYNRDMTESEMMYMDMITGTII
jgi:hypothetical protein